jgi:hypothetical protein
MCNSFTCSIFLPSQFHFFSSLFLFLLLNIIFVFSTFTSSFFFLTYVLSQVLRHFFHFSFALCHNYHIVRKRHTPYIVNSRGLSEQPCLTPFVVSNHSPSFSSTFTLLIPLSFSYTQTFSICFY